MVFEINSTGRYTFWIKMKVVPIRSYSVIKTQATMKVEGVE